MNKEFFTTMVQEKYPEAKVSFDNHGKRRAIRIHITFKPNTRTYTYNSGMIDALHRMGLIPLVLPWQEAGRAVDDLLNGICPTIHLSSREATEKEWCENGQQYRPDYDIAFDQPSMDEFARPTMRCTLVQKRPANDQALRDFRPNPYAYR